MNNDINRETFVIDGSNIFYFSGCPDLAPLYALLCEIVDRGNEFYCIFDANIHHEIRKKLDLPSIEAFKILLKKFRDRFLVVTGSSTADSAILFNADHYGRRIISNDLYQDFDSKYDWLKDRHTTRLVQGNYQDGGLATFEKIDFNFIVNENSSYFYNKLTALIDMKKNSDYLKKEIFNLEDRKIPLTKDTSSSFDELSQLKKSKNRKMQTALSETKPIKPKKNIINFKRKITDKANKERVSMWDDHYVVCPKCGCEHLSTYPHKCKKIKKADVFTPQRDWAVTSQLEKKAHDFLEPRLRTLKIGDMKLYVSIVRECLNVTVISAGWDTFDEMPEIHSEVNRCKTEVLELSECSSLIFSCEWDSCIPLWDKGIDNYDYDDDDDRSPNWPSKTGNPSGGGRDNNPPK